MSRKILKLSIESFKGINNLELNWEEGYAIMGIIADGALGKSSIIDFVQACLTGIVPEESINLLTKKAKGSLDFIIDEEKYTIDISKTKKAETVKIRSENQMSGGKEVIRRIVGNIGINPFEFIKLDVEDQITKFKEIFRIDTMAIEQNRKKVYDERTGVNNQIKAINGYLKQQGVDEHFKTKVQKYKEEKTLGDLPEKLKAANENNKRIELLNLDLQNKQREYKSIEAAITTHQTEINRLQGLMLEKIKEREIKDHERHYVAEEINRLDVIDIAPIEQEIKEVNTYIQEWAAVSVISSKITEAEELKVKSNDLTRDLVKLDQEKEEVIKAAIPDLPNIKLYEPKTDEQGAVIDERQGIYFGDKPVSILSTTEAITFGIELKTGSSSKGLPIFLLDDFESVGSIGRAAVEEMAHKGWQALIAEVDSNQSNLKVVLKNNLLPDAEEKIIKD